MLSLPPSVVIVDDAAADGVEAADVVGVDDVDGDAGIAGDVPRLLMPSTMLITTFSPSVVTQVSVSCGEPSGMRVATKHGLGLRSRSSRPSGSGSGMRVRHTRCLSRTYVSMSGLAIEHMFEVTDRRGGADRRDRRLERLKSAAAADQARLTAALAEKRRTAEAGAGVPPAKRCRGLASEIGLARRDSPRAAAGIWGSPRRWCTRCRTRWPRWSAGRSRSGGRR